jgi:hypothetical protein
MYDSMGNERMNVIGEARVSRDRWTTLCSYPAVPWMHPAAAEMRESIVTIV